MAALSLKRSRMQIGKGLAHQGLGAAHQLERRLELLAQVSLGDVGRDALDEELGQPLRATQDRSQRIGTVFGHHLVDVDLVLALGARNHRDANITAGGMQGLGGLEGPGLAGTAVLGVVADDHARALGCDRDELLVILFAEANGDRGDARHAGLLGTEAVGDTLGDEQLVGAADRVLVVEGLVGDMHRDVGVPVGMGQQLLVLGLLPRLLAGVLGGAGDEVDHATVPPVREHQPVAKEVLDASALEAHKQTGGQGLVLGRAE